MKQPLRRLGLGVIGTGAKLEAKSLKVSLRSTLRLAKCDFVAEAPLKT